MKKLLVFAAIVALAFTGCASTMTVNQQAVTVGGRTIHYVFAESANETGMNFTVADRYDEFGNLMARDAAHNNGIMQAVVPAVITGAATAGGLIGAAAVLRPDMTTVNQAGGVATSASTSGGSTSAATATKTDGVISAKDPMPAISSSTSTNPFTTTTPNAPTPTVTTPTVTSTPTTSSTTKTTNPFTTTTPTTSGGGGGCSTTTTKTGGLDL